MYQLSAQEYPVLTMHVPLTASKCTLSALSQSVAHAALVLSVLTASLHWSALLAAPYAVL